MKNLSKFAALLCCLLISISAMGQNISIKCSDTPLKEVLKTIQSQSSYKFVYNGSLVDMDRKVSVDVENSDIEKILEQVFAGTQITYKIMGNQITLSPKAAARQGKTKVTGTVKDNTGETLPGVYVKSASGVSAITNLDGIFEMEASDGEELAFSFMGMKDTSVNADIRRNMTVVMAPDIEYLENAVVTGYQTISKERATGSYNVIAKAQIEKPASSIAERLIGQTAGMQSTVSADGDVSFEIRGLTSLSTNAAPLLVVDGFAISDSFSSINPNDVESISVLKDAAAASIWGAKSANGVIVITTKSGRNLDKGSVKVDFSAMFKLSPKIDWKYYNPVASSSELVDFELKAWNNGNGIYGSAYYLPNEDNYQEYSRMSLVYQYLNENRLGYLSTSEMNAKIDALRNIDNSDQIKKYLLQNPFIHQYNLNVSSRGERMTNVLSLMYEHNDKYLKGNNSNKYNVGLRSTTKVFKWLDFNFNGNITVTDTQKNGIDLGTLAEISPYQELVDKDGNLVKFYQSLYGPTVQRYFEPLNFPYSDWKYNPIEEMRG
ncbi:MAG: TonB-dependent receptor plug domain-containing protein, partial [Bacteroidales bacterium]|nr:TonB-dependent receptor plug domain-containing protein [Bacteroidales bacterium]